jgi:hypothetical protein
MEGMKCASGESMVASIPILKCYATLLTYKIFLKCAAMILKYTQSLQNCIRKLKLTLFTSI